MATTPSPGTIDNNIKMKRSVFEYAAARLKAFFIPRGGVKTVGGQSIIGTGNIDVGGGNVDYEDADQAVPDPDETLPTTAVRTTAQTLTDAQKAQVQANIGVRQVYSGTSEPSASLGSDGDVYFQYDAS